MSEQEDDLVSFSSLSTYQSPSPSCMAMKGQASPRSRLERHPPTGPTSERQWADRTWYPSIDRQGGKNPPKGLRWNVIPCFYRHWAVIDDCKVCTLKGKDTSVLKKEDSKVSFIKGDPKINLKAHLFCTYCWKNCHTRETCWKIHGKPLNYGKLHLANAQNEDGVEPMIQGGASQDGSTSSRPSEIGKLREEIEQLSSMISSTSFAHTMLHTSINLCGLSKFAPRVVKAIFVGYSNTKKGYKFYDPRYQKIIVTINVTFDESIMIFLCQKKHDLHIEILKGNEAPEMN
ncbi:unnamed protein product [Spirodela intermedia]|uniref:Retroviral polymerase SH3-like domain-containing protein n=1 Tax=Spirodela intermedia TaxID=51605 RepID=A0A7I8IDT5_SPIIN|nr:unnamed protein product [Spirodela intermedia]CAA6655950.1 unnamed protein product [Spirodela intermedia]